MSTLEKFKVAYCDSAEALAKVRRMGLPKDAKIRTSSPHLLTHYADQAISLEAALGAEVYDDFKKSIPQFGMDIYDLCYAFPNARKYARTLARAAIMFQRTMLKAACLEDSDFVEPRLVVRLVTGDAGVDATLNTNWFDLIGSNPRTEVVEVKIKAPVVQESDVGFFKRFLFRGPEYFIFRSVLAATKFLPMVFRKEPRALIFKECELLHEVAAHLAVRRIPLQRMERPKPAKPSAPVESGVEEDCLKGLEDLLMKRAEQYLCHSVRALVVQLGVVALSEEVFRQNRAEESMLERLRPFASKALVLTNYPGSAEDYGMFLACKTHRIPLIAFQHGISREVNQVHGDLGVENSAADLTMVFNETAKMKTDSTQYHHGRCAAIGFPTKGRRLKRIPKLFFKPTEDILFISTNVYNGNINSVKGTMSDYESCSLERNLITNVLDKIAFRVSYKRYLPILRYADPDPAFEEACRSSNIDVLTNDIDARYYVKSAKILVTCRATSTMSWCALSGRPMCFIDVPGQMPLADAIKEEFKESFFYFNSGDDSELSRLREFLNQPLSEIEAQWERKRRKREEFISRHIDTPSASCGDLGAKILSERGLEDFSWLSLGEMEPPKRYLEAPEPSALKTHGLN